MTGPDGDTANSTPPAGRAARGRTTVLGLTGGIGMGKSTVAAMFRDLGVPVHDADASVHALYAPGGAAVGPVGAAFPGAVRDDGEGPFVDRTALSALVVGRPDAMRRLEGIVHPLVRAEEGHFLRENADAPLVVLDIPLLFETGADARVDRVVVVSAPEAVRRARVLARPGMTPAKLDAIVAKQVPDGVKRSRADHIIDTAASLQRTRAEVAALVDGLLGRADGNE